MDRLLIYVNYDQSEYTNYFHLAINDNVVINYCPEEKIENVFKRIIEEESGNKNFQLYVVRDKNASEWDYLDTFREYNIEERHSISNMDSEQLCQVMHTLFENEYRTGRKDDASNKKSIEIIYSGVLHRNDSETVETLRQAEEILKRGGEEMTELARIIKEKYERMNSHE